MAQSKSTKDLISGLCEGLEPVKPLAPWWKSFLQALVPSLSVLMVFLYFMADMDAMKERLASSRFWLEQGLIALTALLSLVSAITLAVPGKIRRWQVHLPIITATLWAGLVALFLFNFALSKPADAWDFHPTFACPSAIAILSIPLVFFIFFAVRRGAHLSPSWSGFFILASGSSLAALGLQVACPMGNPAHLLVFHVAPAFIIAGTGVFLGRFILRK